MAHGSCKNTFVILIVTVILAVIEILKLGNNCQVYRPTPTNMTVPLIVSYHGGST